MILKWRQAAGKKQGVGRQAAGGGKKNTEK
jgi:hypothetical protein